MNDTGVLEAGPLAESARKQDQQPAARMTCKARGQHGTPHLLAFGGPLFKGSQVAGSGRCHDVHLRSPPGPPDPSMRVAASIWCDT